jgi:hypothetical protein
MRIPRLLLPLALTLHILNAKSPPLICPGGTPLGRFALTVVPPEGGTPRSLQTVNRLLEGDTITYHPTEIDSPSEKKTQIVLLLVPSNGSKILVYEPKPADLDTSWKVPFRAQLASLVWGPAGLDKSKVTGLVARNDELIGQLADYAEKTEETQALIEAITRQQALDTGQTVDVAVASFASQFPSAKLDRTQPTDAQVGALLHGVNPSLSTYDPLAQNPTQQAAQTAGLAAAVAGLFFGANGVGMAVTGGAVLVNLHSLVFPHTQFLSALTQADPADAAAQPTALCGSKPPAVSRTEFAFLWAVRFPDVSAPALSLKSAIHLPAGLKSTVPLAAKDWKFVPRFQDWRLVSDDDNASADGPVSVPVSAHLNTSAKTIDLDLTNAKLKAGIWKLAANWDWEPVTVAGSLVLHDFSAFKSAHLAPDSQDELTAGAGTLDLQLTGDDFEFVHKVEYEKQGDPFAEPQPLPFHLPKEPPAGPEASLKVRLDAKPLATGNYVFLLAQTDGKSHQVPFKVLPAPPSVTGTPVVLNTGIDSQTVALHGTSLDRIQEITAHDAEFTLGDEGDGATRNVTVKLTPAAKAGALMAAQLKVKDFAAPVSVDDAFLIAGPRPAITTVRESLQSNLGIALNPGEIAASSPVSFEAGTLHAPAVSEVDLSCADSPDSSPLKITMGESKDPVKLTQESADTLFLSFLPKAVGPPGCAVAATLVTPKSGRSDRRKLGVIVLLPQIDSFQITNEKAGETSYVASLEGHDLEGVTKVGWDSQTGTPVESIPVPVAGPGNKETLRLAVSWPAPTPHASLYIWLRGEDHGRLTTTKY